MRTSPTNTAMIFTTAVVSPTPAAIKAARLAAGMAQKDAARAAGLANRERWTEYESGRRNMPALRWAFFNNELRNRK